MCKILGVFLDDNLSFKTHIFGGVKKSRQMCNLLLCAFHELNNDIIISLDKVYIRSLLNYTSIIYSPYYKYFIDLLENLQRNFNNKLPGLCNLNCIDHLRICNIESLELKRIRSDSVLFTSYCITLLNVIHLSLLRFLQIFTILEVIASNLKKHAHLIIRLNHFIIRCANKWNLLNNNI